MVEYKEIQGGHTSGGLTYTMEFCRKQNGKRTQEWIVKCFSLADELRPFLEPGRSPRGLDVLSVEKKLAMTHDLVVNACILIMRGEK